MTTNEVFIQQLLRNVPEIQPVYDEHFADNDELLPHLFMGDVTRFVIAEAGRPEPRVVLVRLLQELESGLTNGSEQVKELIAVSFVENLCGEEALKILEPIMGPNLRKEVRTICW